MDDVKAELAALRQRISDLEARLAGRTELEGDDHHPTRRGLLAGVVAAVAGGAALASASPAEAANGQPIVLGSSGNTATAPTGTAFIGTPGSGGYCIGATDNGLNAFPQSAAIAGHTRGNFGNGVLGYDNSPNAGGTGVIGWSINGAGVLGVTEADRPDTYGVYRYQYRPRRPGNSQGGESQQHWGTSRQHSPPLERLSR